MTRSGKEFWKPYRTMNIIVRYGLTVSVEGDAYLQENRCRVTEVYNGTIVNL